MLMRLLLTIIVVTVVNDAAPAQACPVGSPCTKYNKTVILEEPAHNYWHSTKGAVPGWSLARITAFLMRGSWVPTTRPPGTIGPGLLASDGINTIQYVKPSRLRFITPDLADKKLDLRDNERLVLIRRIEKQGRAILVEVDGSVWKLAACPKRTDQACLLPAGSLTLTPVEQAVAP